jgi:hypothetical protein
VPRRHRIGTTPKPASIRAPAGPSQPRLRAAGARRSQKNVEVRSAIGRLGPVAPWELEVLLPVIHDVIERALHPDAEEPDAQTETPTKR